MLIKSPYDQIKLAYSTVWGSSFLNQYREVLTNLIGSPHGDRGALDWGCGSGSVVQWLNKSGWKAEGKDLATELIAIAKTMYPLRNFSVGDIRVAIQPNAFELVTATWDVLNHLQSEEDFVAALQNIAQSLRQGGVFVFDLNSRAGYLSRWNGTSVEDSAEWFVAVQRSFEKENLFAKARIWTYQRTVSKNELDGHWIRRDATVMQREFPHDVVLSALKRSGFGSIETFDSVADFGSSEIGRTFYRCVK